jgi:hypothetical protein
MELDQWLVVYRAMAYCYAAKERSSWAVLVGGLVAQAILVVALVFLVSVEPIPFTGFRYFVEIALAAVGLISCLGWLGAHARVNAEGRHLARLLRSIECQFAGGEFLRSLHRLSAGEKVCVSGSDWTCDEWLPSVSKLPVAARLGAGGFLALIPSIFLAGWIAVLVRVLLT